MKNTLRRAFYYFLSATLSIPGFSYAAGPPSPGFGISVDPAAIGRDSSGISDSTSLANFFINLVDWFAWFVALAAVVMGLYAGFLFITAAGDDTKLKDAKKTLFYAIVGVVVSILAFSIVAIASLFACDGWSC